MPDIVINTVLIVNNLIKIYVKNTQEKSLAKARLLWEESIFSATYRMFMVFSRRVLRSSAFGSANATPGALASPSPFAPNMATTA